MNICTATSKNWKRLNVDPSLKLTTRANKVLSNKIILPVEYLTSLANITQIKIITNYIIQHKLKIFDAIYTLAANLLESKQLFNAPHVQIVLNEKAAKLDDYLLNISLPQNERDILGAIYQSILKEGKKNNMGSYYTPCDVVENMTANLSFSNGENFLDPCCGSGSFLLALSAKPDQIFGIDNDPIAVFICKVNLLLKYADIVFYPQVYCCDFLKKGLPKPISLKVKKFDYIVTNPPWGATSRVIECREILSKETFSYFFIKSFNLLKRNGFVRFLFPVSILNVKTHKDIRSFMLNNGNLESITIYDGVFSGVTTRYVDIKQSNCAKQNFVNVYTQGEINKIDKNTFYITKNLVFTFLTELDKGIIEKVRNKGSFSLKKSIWALGIVTGDNKTKLSKQSSFFAEPVYTGKEICAYNLKQPQYYIEYKRDNFQQVAKDEYYRSKEKLVYKFISSKLTFAYDDKQALFLNSANILIPSIPNMSIKSVMAFLNSELFQYLYQTLFSEVKVLKGNLEELPFPNLTDEQNKFFTEQIDEILTGNLFAQTLVQRKIYEIFNINEEEQKYIKEKLNGTIN